MITSRQLVPREEPREYRTAPAAITPKQVKYARIEQSPDRFDSGTGRVTSSIRAVDTDSGEVVAEKVLYSHCSILPSQIISAESEVRIAAIAAKYEIQKERTK